MVLLDNYIVSWSRYCLVGGSVILGVTNSLRHLEIPNPPRLCKTVDCSLQTDSRFPFLRTTPRKLIEHGEAELMPTRAFTTMF